MFWIILSSVFVLVAILLLILVRDDVGSICAWLIFVGIVFGLVIPVMVNINWQSRKIEMEMISVVQQNKIEKIEQMRKTFFKIAENVTMSVDLANHELAKSINAEIVEIEQFINGYNKTLAKWQTHYKFKFWTYCFVKPYSDKPIELKF